MWHEEQEGMCTCNRTLLGAESPADSRVTETTKSIHPLLSLQPSQTCPKGAVVLGNLGRGDVAMLRNTQQGLSSPSCATVALLFLPMSSASLFAKPSFTLSHSPSCIEGACREPGNGSYPSQQGFQRCEFCGQQSQDFHVA